MMDCGICQILEGIENFQEIRDMDNSFFKILDVKLLSTLHTGLIRTLPKVA